MKDSKTLRVGTLNVRTLTGKIGAVAALATEAGVNVLAMQETRLASDAARSSSSAFRAAGWTLHQGPQRLDGSRRGHHRGRPGPVSGDAGGYGSRWALDGSESGAGGPPATPRAEHLPACRRQGPWQPHCAGGNTMGAQHGGGVRAAGRPEPDRGLVPLGWPPG